MKCSIFLLACITIAKSQELFPVTIIHLNDMHARFDETNMASSTCKEGDACIGGYARVVSKVKELLLTKATKNPLYLNAADNYQGTLWYNIYRWNVTSYFLNLLPADAMVRKFQTFPLHY
jgi:5'-nucleotidase